MRNIVGFIAIFCLFVSASCEKEGTTPVGTSSLSFSFTTNFDGEPIVMNEKTYDYNGQAIRFSKVNFYLSDLTLGGKEIADVSFIDLTKTHDSEEAAETGTLINFSKVPIGDYTSLSFGIGVAADLNRTKPSEYATSHPLGADHSGEYWEAWNSYIFVKIEGQYDADGNGFDANDVAFAYHIGQDEFYKTLSAEFNSAIVIEKDVPQEVELRLNIKELFTTSDGSLLELSAHDPNNQMDVMRMIMDNFTTALRYVK